MANYDESDVVITGLGITSAIGQGKNDFFSALIKGQTSFGIMKRPGRQNGTSFIGAEINNLRSVDSFSSKRAIRTASLSSQVGLVTLHEAWSEARLYEAEPDRIGLIVGGSNFQQREMLNLYDKYGQQPDYITPTYGFSFMDSDLCGLCTEEFGIRGMAFTIGGASASGQLAVIQAIQAIISGQVDICIVMGALMDLSYLECQALRSLGAMGSDKYRGDPDKACRPFDLDRDGFIFGESCGVIVIEKAVSAKKRNVTPYAKIKGWAVGGDGNRNPNPSYEGEKRVIKQALELGRLTPDQIDYIKPHGTGSLIGDEIELKAIKDFKFSNAYINTTKSIIGHGLSAAGAVEIIATVLQMGKSTLHPSRNLINPIDNSLNWIRDKSISTNIQTAICLSMGFGGVNTALCLENLQ
ncbi:polyketide beta-ketoacyl:ACP synthase [Paenibacillus alba]|uniref:beta-ketoacyl synthase N-terminal-like domain-containing protein n=1 Tax=Paenibacillus alba TaxID=1197127 RepID=UPI001563A685|nr:beta-ketoacyl synthase N-terminal-like domain-containing protein [Paenibacillus alba]NQX71868.1 polyketide beta-ketoacyl:ACP synthase [Paenibacillus alba]